MKDLIFYLILVFVGVILAWGGWYLTIKTMPPIKVQIVGDPKNISLKNIVVNGQKYYLNDVDWVFGEPIITKEK